MYEPESTREKVGTADEIIMIATLLENRNSNRTPPGRGRLGFRSVGPESTEWESLLARTEHSVFHEPIWARVLADGLNGEPFCVILTRDGAPVAGMIGVELRFLWNRQLYFSIPYGGVVGQVPDGDELAPILDRLARERRVARIRIVDWPAIAVPAIPNSKILEDHTHILDFDGLTYDALWTRFKKNLRRDVRKAQRSNVRVVEAEDESDVQAFYDLYLASMDRNRAIPRYGREFVAAFFRHLVPADRGAIFLAKIDEQPIAGIMVANSSRMGHYVMGGSRSEALRLCPNDLLINHAIRDALSKGLHAFDFLPSGPDDLALQRFKRKWDARPVRINTATIDRKPLSMALWNGALKVSHTRLFRHLLVRYRSRP